MPRSLPARNIEMEIDGFRWPPDTEPNAYIITMEAHAMEMLAQSNAIPDKVVQPTVKATTKVPTNSAVSAVKVSGFMARPKSPQGAQSPGQLGSVLGLRAHLA
mmetsp:Transcript_110698/g.263998  ORF Transcript_110698/g.263998 Transcript_110698/m.263998 type:complete len:103 (-) Transcript_110698:2-310(-)